jgi:Family of unknown function (DUF5694)
MMEPAMPRATRSSVFALVAVGVWCGAASAQQTRVPPASQARVMILGTYHFANPGLDVVKIETADILSPGKQAEVEAVVEALSAFRPTKIAVEVRAPSVARVDSLYAAYRAGRHSPGRSEVQQLGFRLAHRFAHPRLYGIDHEGDFPFEALMAYAQEHDPDFVAWAQAQLAAITAESNRQQRENTLTEILRSRNDPEAIAEGHGLYMVMGGVGAGDTYVGADLLAAWYERNIRTFADLRALAEPDERILVIFGAGHAAILRALVDSDPDLVLVEANDYLPVAR